VPPVVAEVDADDLDDPRPRAVRREGPHPSVLEEQRIDGEQRHLEEEKDHPLGHSASEVGEAVGEAVDATAAGTGDEELQPDEEEEDRYGERDGVQLHGEPEKGV